jgi:hypothetical protein
LPSGVGLVTPGAGWIVTGAETVVAAVATVQFPTYVATLPGVARSIVPPGPTSLRAVARVQASAGLEQSAVPWAVEAA